MYKMCILLAALTALVIIPTQTEASFSFALPGNWGNSKRGFNFALPGKWGNVKRNGAAKVDCSDISAETVLNIYRAIHEEAARLQFCLPQVSGDNIEDGKH